MVQTIVRGFPRVNAFLLSDAAVEKVNYFCWMRFSPFPSFPELTLRISSESRAVPSNHEFPEEIRRPAAMKAQKKINRLTGATIRNLRAE
jgi:hypothetical protein